MCSSVYLSLEEKILLCLIFETLADLVVRTFLPVKIVSFLPLTLHGNSLLSKLSLPLPRFFLFDNTEMFYVGNES